MRGTVAFACYFNLIVRPLVWHRYERSLVEFGFGEFGPTHEVRLPTVGGDEKVYGTSKLYLHAGQASRIFNIDETTVSSPATYNEKPLAGRDEVILGDRSYGHFTYVSVMSMPDYDRAELKTLNAAGQSVDVAAAHFHHGRAWPGMVRSFDFALPWLVVLQAPVVVSHHASFFRLMVTVAR